MPFNEETLNSTTTVLQARLWHLITHKDLYAIKQSNQTKPNPYFSRVWFRCLMVFQHLWVI